MDDAFTIPTEAASTCLQIARSMIAVLDENATPFADWLYQSLMKVLKGSESKGRLNKEKLWCDFHKLRSSENFFTHWKQFMVELKLNPYPLFFQHVTQEVFESMITKELSLGHDTDEIKEDIPRLTENEEAALRYVAGYVIKEVKDNLKAPRDNDKLVIMQKLIQTDSESSFGTSESWVKAIDRGGLVKITDSAFQFFYAVEFSLRRHLHISNTSKMDTKFQSKVLNSLVTDDDILFQWCLTGQTEEPSSASCMELIVQKWVTVRGFSFASSIMEIYKQKNKKGTEKSKSMRTKLFT